MMDYIVELDGIRKDLNDVVFNLVDNPLLRHERELLVEARDKVIEALNSFKKLKGTR